MASKLYAVGLWCYRHAWQVILGWLLVFVVIGGSALAFPGRFNDTFIIPSAPSQNALHSLRMTFPEASGVTALAVVVPASGTPVTSSIVRRVIDKGVKLFESDPAVAGVISPWNEQVSGLVSPKAEAAIIRVRLKLTRPQPSDLKPLNTIAQQIQAELPSGSTVTMGGEAFAIELPKFSAVEMIGIAVALVVLVLVLGSLIAAGMPIVTAAIGVSLTAAIMFLVAWFTTVNSVTPMLAVMLGLAVGIDYALLILSRNREQLMDQRLSTEESTGRAIATAGSAVVFAGLTVVIALLGLAIAQIPFLTVMGIFAALGVACAVVISLTLLPALMGLAAERLRPRKAKIGDRVRTEKIGRIRHRGRFLRAWVGAAIRWPWVTIVLISMGLGLVALPAQHLHLSLPNSGQHASLASDRIAYDQINKYFGPGFNGPLIVMVDLLPSTDPVGVLARIRKEIEIMPAVSAVTVATPNRNADTGFIQVIPTTGPDNPKTHKLVQALREQEPHWRATQGVNTAVTGATAVEIDVSAGLARALLPFGIFVIGLSLILLTIMFRSIAIPIKAALSYLLSVGAAFGITTLVFNDGVASWLANLEKPTAIISFLPILLMGILFGLAMDYEVFLVSRIREEYVHGESARDAIVEGFVGSGRVVGAAGLIMFAVFAFFVPSGMAAVKVIAFGLAVGILVDAFIVRMTLVPAVLALLGDKAWWLPKWLSSWLPRVDIEGELLSKELDLAHWPGTDDAVYAHDLAVAPLAEPFSLILPKGGVAAVIGGDERRAVLLALSGRLASSSGRARVGGALLPEQAGKVRLATSYVDAAMTELVPDDLSWAIHRRIQVIIIENADLLSYESGRKAVAAIISIARAHRDYAVILGGLHQEVLQHFNPDVFLTVRSIAHAN